MDWHDFLAFRGRELAPGGRMVVVTLGLDDAGEAGFGAVMEALAESLHILVERGTLRPEELRRMAVPTVGRSRKELLAPFAPSGRFEGLSVEHLELCDVEDQFWARYLVDGDPPRSERAGPGSPGPRSSLLSPRPWTPRRGPRCSSKS